jgi:hypothetical protein
MAQQKALGYTPENTPPEIQREINLFTNALSNIEKQKTDISTGKTQGASNFVNRIANTYNLPGGYATALPTVQLYAENPNNPFFANYTPEQRAMFEAAATELQSGQFATLNQGYQEPTSPNAPAGMGWVSQLVPGWNTGQPIPTGTARLASAQLWNQVPWSQREMFGGYLQSGYQTGIPTQRDYEELIAQRLPRQKNMASWKSALQV